jgi:DNA-binding transcriptional ArsR family regulator
MATTPRPLIDSVVRSVCGREVERVVRLTGGGMNETYRVELPNHVAAVVRIARQPVPWFTDEAHVLAQARGVGVPAPEVLGVEQVDHNGERLSFSIQRLVLGRPLGELAGELPVSRPAVSQHLKVLKDAGLVIDRRAGTRRIYQLDPAGVGALRAELDRFWNQALAAFKAAAEEGHEEVS